MDNARFVISRGKVIERYGFLKEICPRISFSLKTNPEVGKILEEETDSFFSVHTEEGLRDVSDMKRVWFLSQGATEGFFREMLERGITRFVVDNRADLGNFLKAMEGRNGIDLLLRMRFHETTVYKGRYFLFGMTADEINSLVPGLRRNEGIRYLGVHFHRSSQNTGNWSLKYMIQEMLTEDTLANIDLMNIGGGLPVAYRNTSDSNIGYILGKIRELRDWLETRNIRLIMEPGRPIAAPAVKLEAFVISVDGRHITVNCSVYNSSMDTIIVPHKLPVEGEGRGDSFVIKGCTPCSMDIFRYDVNLPMPGVGDKITFLNAGAYNFTTSFCNLGRPDVVVVD